MIKWTDLTYRRGDGYDQCRESWQAKFKGLTIQVHKNVQEDMRVWFLTTYPEWFVKEPLEGVREREDAMQLAMAKVKKQLRDALGDIIDQEEARG